MKNIEIKKMANDLNIDLIGSYRKGFVHIMDLSNPMCKCEIHASVFFKGNENDENIIAIFKTINDIRTKGLDEFKSHTMHIMYANALEYESSNEDIDGMSGIDYAMNEYAKIDEMFTKEESSKLDLSLCENGVKGYLIAFSK